MEKELYLLCECNIISPSSVDVICYIDYLKGDTHTRRERLYKAPAICLSLLFCGFSSVKWHVVLWPLFYFFSIFPFLTEKRSQLKTIGLSRAAFRPAVSPGVEQSRVRACVRVGKQNVIIHIYSTHTNIHAYICSSGNYL